MNKSYLLPLSVLALAFSAATAAADDNGAYNTSTTDTVTMGTNTETGGEAPGDAEAMQAIQDQAQTTKDNWGGDAQRQAVEGGNK